ncbi:MAG: hypothetical protein GY780_05685 [bacterium]|nr:hypothetical protein [bacterium]
MEMLSILVAFLVLAILGGPAFVLRKRYGTNDVRFKFGFNLSLFLVGVLFLLWGLLSESKGYVVFAKLGAAPISGNQNIGIGLVLCLFAVKSIWKQKMY